MFIELIKIIDNEECVMIVNASKISTISPTKKGKCIIEIDNIGRCVYENDYMILKETLGAAQ